MTLLRCTSLLLSLLIATSCARVAPKFEPEKEASDYEVTPAEKRVHSYFWNTLHRGHYDEVDQVIDSLHLLYQDDPNDFRTAAHLGFAYAWSITERKRRQNLTPKIAGHADLAETYFSEAHTLNPNDPRIHGFKAGFMLANASRHNDQKKQTRAYFEGQKAIDSWPSFNLFSIGYVMSTLPHRKDRYQEALGYQWKNLEICLEREINRANPNLSDIDAIPKRVSDHYKKSRACTNSWIAPHNVEGFLLNLGDMLVKNADTLAAREVYRAAQNVEGYQQWPYREKLQQRLANMEENIERFRRTEDRIDDDRVVFINTRFACTGCHQMSEREFSRQQDRVPLAASYYFIQ